MFWPVLYAADEGLRRRNVLQLVVDWFCYIFAHNRSPTPSSNCMLCHQTHHCLLIHQLMQLQWEVFPFKARCPHMSWGKWACHFPKPFVCNVILQWSNVANLCSSQWKFLYLVLYSQFLLSLCIAINTADVCHFSGVGQHFSFKRIAIHKH